MKFESNEVIALTNWYFNDMRKRGFKFFDEIVNVYIVDRTDSCASTSFSRVNYKNDTAAISISFSRYYIEDTSLQSLRNTIVHELCHCLKGTLNEIHGKNWKAWAKKANAIYNLEVSTYATREECIGIFKHQKYTITCPKCGIIDGYDRMSSTLKYQYKNKKRTCTRCHSYVDLVQNR